MDAPWLDLAEEYLGEHELAGVNNNNQFILDCFNYTSYKASCDEIHWCAAAQCRFLEETGYESTGRADAASFLTYGTSCSPRRGAIVVFQWENGSYHVTCMKDLSLWATQSLVGCVGGNQSHRMKLSYYDRKYIKAIRWPITKGKNL